MALYDCSPSNQRKLEFKFDLWESTSHVCLTGETANDLVGG